MAGRGLVQRPLHHAFEVCVVLTNPSAGATHRKTRPDDGRDLGSKQNLTRFGNRCRDAGRRHAKSYPLHGSAKELSILSLVDRLEVGANQGHIVFLEYAGLSQIDREIESCLPTDRGKQRVGTLQRNDLLDRVHGHRLDIGSVRRLWVGHDRGGIRVDENDSIALLPKRLTRLRARIIELTGLSDYDRTRTDH